MSNVNNKIIKDEDIELDQETISKIKEKKKERIEELELTNEEISSKIQSKQLKKKLDLVKVGTVAEAFIEQKKRFIKLLKASWFGTVIFVLVLPVILSMVHAWSIASMAERFGSDYTKSFFMGLCFAGLFESLMIGQILQFNHRGSRYTMISAMFVLAIVTSLEIYKRGFNALELGDILRFVGGTFLIPIIHSFIVQIREKAEGKDKRDFDKLPEPVQKTILNDMKQIKKEYELYKNSPTTIIKKTNPKTGVVREVQEKQYKITRRNFREYSNSKRITQDSLRRLCTDYGIGDNVCWKEFPSKRKSNSKGLEGTIESNEPEFSYNELKEIKQMFFLNESDYTNIPNSKFFRYMEFLVKGKDLQRIFKIISKRFGSSITLGELQKIIPEDSGLKKYILELETVHGSDKSLEMVLNSNSL